MLRRYRMMTATATDGTTILAATEGAGPAILVLHGGMNDESAWQRVATRLVPRFRVIRVRRRRYRMDLDPPPTLTEEMTDIVALGDAIGRPVPLVGHSSGGVVALEALLAAPG